MHVRLVEDSAIVRQRCAAVPAARVVVWVGYGLPARPATVWAGEHLRVWSGRGESNSLGLVPAVDNPHVWRRRVVNAILIVGLVGAILTGTASSSPLAVRSASAGTSAVPATLPRPLTRAPIDRHPFPRLFMINRADDISTLWKYDWVVGGAWQDVERYHSRNRNGIAMTYVRLDDPPYDLSKLTLDKSHYWHICSMMNIASGAVSGNRHFPGEQERYTFERWPGGTDTVTDGAAASVGYMRPWRAETDSKHTSAGSFVTERGCPYGTTVHVWDLANVGLLNGQLQVYAAKKSRVYRRGWDGIWSDNAYSRYDRAWTDGLQASYTYIRNSLPGKSVGGNGAWISWYRRGWAGSDPDGFLKMTNANLVEAFAPLYGTRNQANVDSFISWNNRCLEYPDPYGRPRYNAFWDAYVSPSYRRVRWGFTLSLMASMYYMAPISDPYKNPDPWYDEYWGGSLNRRGYLGRPTGPPVKLKSGIWRRDFRAGVALNNSTGSPQTVDLHGTFRHLSGRQDRAVNTGKRVRSVRIANRDGVILLR
jgi:hypothetical protein